MAHVKNKSEGSVTVAINGSAINWKAGETLEVPDEHAKRLSQKHFEVINDAPKKGRRGE